MESRSIYSQAGAQKIKLGFNWELTVWVQVCYAHNPHILVVFTGTSLQWRYLWLLKKKASSTISISWQNYIVSNRTTVKSSNMLARTLVEI